MVRTLRTNQVDEAMPKTQKPVRAYAFEAPIAVPRFEEAAGFYTTPQRSAAMARVKGADTRPEVKFRKALWRAGLRFRVHPKKLPGKPDISNQRLRLAIFIDGEFWHGHDWATKQQAIKTNRGFWLPKIERNMQRDRHVNARLHAMNFRVFRFWAHEIDRELGRCLAEVLGYVRQALRY